jgi:hypothetical protein
MGANHHDLYHIEVSIVRDAGPLVRNPGTSETMGHGSINSTMACVRVSDQEADAARHNALMDAF